VCRKTAAGDALNDVPDREIVASRASLHVRTGSGRLTAVAGSACVHFPNGAWPSMRAADRVMLRSPPSIALPSAERCRNRHVKVIDFFAPDKSAAQRVGPKTVL